jgi:hypothetical protein
MHHKRGKSKNQRAGCLLCKPHKMNGSGGMKLNVIKIGFGKIRDEVHAKFDMKTEIF